MAKVPYHRPSHTLLPVRRPPARPRNADAWQRFLNSPAWRKLSKLMLTGEPYCRRCRTEGRWVAATQVHHQKGRDFEYAFDEQWLEPICQSHHSIETARSKGQSQSEPGPKAVEAMQPFRYV